MSKISGDHLIQVKNNEILTLRLYCSINVVSARRDTNRNIKRLVLLVIRIVKSNDSSLGLSSERNRKLKEKKTCEFI